MSQVVREELLTGFVNVLAELISMIEIVTIVAVVAMVSMVARLRGYKIAVFSRWSQ